MSMALTPCHRRRRPIMSRTALCLLGVLTLALSVGTAQAQTPAAPQPPPCPAALDKLSDALANAIIESQKCSQTTQEAESILELGLRHEEQIALLGKVQD